MADDLGFTIEGWDEFVKDFENIVNNWEERKAKLLTRLALIYKGDVMLNVPADTGTLVDSIKVYRGGIPHDYVEVGSNLSYAKFVNDGHIQHSRLLPVSCLSAGGKKKNYNTVEGKGGMMYVTLSERYVKGAHFMEKGMSGAKPRLENEIDKFMKDIKKEFEGNK